jgi:hypothetical protein
MDIVSKLLDHPVGVRHKELQLQIYLSIPAAELLHQPGIISPRYAAF